MEYSTQDLQNMTFAQIADVIGKEWPRVKERGTGSLAMGACPANPYWEAMQSFNATTIAAAGAHGADSAQSMVLYFLSNAAAMRGENAKGIRAELKRRLRENGYKI